MKPGVAVQTRPPLHSARWANASLPSPPPGSIELLARFAPRSTPSAHSSASRSTGKGGRIGESALPSSRCTDLHCLFDHVHAVGRNPLAKKPSRSATRAAGLLQSSAVRPPAARQAPSALHPADRCTCRSAQPATRGAERRLLAASLPRNGARAHSLAFTKWVRSTSGISPPSPQKRACQRGSTAQPKYHFGWALRRAATAGRACRISPIAPSRTIRTRVCSYCCDKKSIFS